MPTASFTGYKKSPKLFEADNGTVASDMRWYPEKGFENISTLACFLGEDYEELHPFPDPSASKQLKGK